MSRLNKENLCDMRLKQILHLTKTNKILAINMLIQSIELSAIEDAIAHLETEQFVNDWAQDVYYENERE